MSEKAKALDMEDKETKATDKIQEVDMFITQSIDNPNIEVENSY